MGRGEDFGVKCFAPESFYSWTPPVGNIPPPPMPLSCEGVSAGGWLGAGMLEGAGWTTLGAVGRT